MSLFQLKKEKIASTWSILLESPSFWFWAFCLFHLIVWTLVPTLLYANPPTDSVEGIAWGNLWLWGYEKHPFLAPWVTAWVTNVTGVIGWPIYLLSQLTIVASFYAVWVLAKKFLLPWQALLSVVLLEGVNYFNLQSASFNPNLLLLPWWAWTSVCFYKAVFEKPNRSLFWWCGVGVFAGLGLITKYEIGLLFIILAIILILTKEGRQSFKHLGIYLAILIAFFIFLPNLIWLIHHQFDAVFYVAEELNVTKVYLPKILMVFYHPLKFLLDQGGAVLPAILIFLLFFIRAKNAYPSSPLLREQEKGPIFFLTLLAWAPLTLTLLLSLFDDANLVSRWAFPFFLFTGIWVVWKWLPDIYSRRATRGTVETRFIASLLITVLLLNIIYVLGEVFLFVGMPLLTHRTSHFESFPGKVVATQLTTEWHTRYHKPLYFVAGSHDVVVNIVAYSSDRPKPYFDWDPVESPWINEAEVKQKGAVFVWLIREGTTRDFSFLRQRFPALCCEKVEIFQRLSPITVEPVRLLVAFLPPT